MLPPSGRRLKQGCISRMPRHWSMISSSGVPRRRCSEMRRQASSVTPFWKVPPLPSQPKSFEGLAVLVRRDGDVEVAQRGAELRRRAGQDAGSGPRGRRGHGLPPSARQSGSVRLHATASSFP